ncbi:MAG TPA: hypothetical protein VEY95_05960 [Azospirillaceae bacterium]|nr:hypothetical protein [Azospirillaceae bacterium]
MTAQTRNHTRSPRLPALALATGIALAAWTGAAAQQRTAAADGRALRTDVDVRVLRDTDAGPRSPGGAPGAGRPMVDETALRHFASRNDYARVDAEIRRLRQRHPGWEPPRDLFGGAAPGTPAVDERGLWAALERGAHGQVREEIRILSQLHPGWQPPAELLRLLRSAELRANLKTAEDGGRWNAIVEAYRAEPDHFGCGDIEAAWMAADAMFRTGDRPGAYALYGRLMDGCDADLRLSTLQKALANRDDRRIAPLFAKEEARTRTEAQSVRFAQIVRDWKGDGRAEETPESRERAKYGEALRGLARATPEALAQIEAETSRLRHADGAIALGWHHHNAGRLNEAKEWFERALSWRRTPKAAEGLAFTLQKQGDEAGARRVAQEWGARAPALADLLRGGSSGAGRALEAGNLAEAVRLTDPAPGRRTTPGDLMVRGWALQRLQRPTEAEAAFRAALAGTTDPTKQVEAALGLATVLVERGLVDEADEIVRRHRVPADQARGVASAVTTQRALDAYDRGDYTRALAMIREIRREDPAAGSLALMEGWTLVKVGQYAQAKRLFSRLHDTYASPEALQGIRVADGYLRGWKDE